MRNYGLHAIVAVVGLWPAAALAHPGHGVFSEISGTTLLHYLVEPSHALAASAITLLAALTVRGVARRIAGGGREPTGATRRPGPGAPR